LFRVGEAISARFDETHAFLVTIQKFFQGQFGIFHVRDDLFEAGEKVLEFFRRVSGIGGGREQSAGDHGGSFCLDRVAAYSQSGRQVSLPVACGDPDIK
jgi:hypothetical protein